MAPHDIFYFYSNCIDKEAKAEKSKDRTANHSRVPEGPQRSKFQQPNPELFLTVRDMTLVM